MCFFFFFFNLELKNSITRRNDMPEFNETSIYTPGPDDFPQESKLGLCDFLRRTKIKTLDILNMFYTKFTFDRSD